MRFYQSLGILLLIALATGSLAGQTPNPSPADKTKTFGSSLEKYNKKKDKKSTDPSVEAKLTPPDGEIRIETDLVINDVLVTNSKGDIIQGLAKENFVVFEDGVPQKIEMFSFGTRTKVPRSIIFIVDHLGLQQPYLNQSIVAAKTLVNLIGPVDRMAIITSDEKLRQDLTNNKQALNAALDLIANEKPNVWGGREFSSLLAALNEMFEGDSQRIVVFQGDGNHSIWLKPDSETPFRVSKSTLEKSASKYSRTTYRPGYGFADIRNSIESSRATIYSGITGMRYIGLSHREQMENAKQSILDLNKHYYSNENLPLLVREYQSARAESGLAGQIAMFKVAELSGGTADFIEKPEDARSVYANILTIMTNRYAIGYYPTNQNRDGKRRSVKVVVKGHPEFIVTTRKTYSLQ